ncbi:hypothetical protein D9619_006876 [Psilocybe cf. subviscida]|uniref:Glyoxal oxidase n=1 Tax=Psilocybe cf. subviscida TaxID=2480587 RepID=A0A8H5B4B8_9AGAR|nr:hypothetical protein D9619_006876 [Psilocybe cf. subviscida]
MKRPNLYLLLCSNAIHFQRTMSQTLATKIPPPGQPEHKGEPGKFEIVEKSLVSAQQMFLGTPDKIYMLDKVQNNAAQINGHPAWAAELRLSDNSQRPMDVLTNSFCAGGNVLANGTWINAGGNQAVGYGGNPAKAQDGSSGPYYDADGRQSIRMLDPCSGNDCQWYMSTFEIGQRWYPTLETLEDGTIIILGGCRNGGYVNDATQSNPTYEFFPPTGSPITSQLLTNTLPANLYPLTWLLPSGNLLLQSTWSTALLDWRTKVETPLDDMPDAVRTYPASAGTAMLPLTPENNWTATIMFCGGSNIDAAEFSSPDFIPPQRAASTSCVKLTPDVSRSYVHEDPLPERRSMTNFVLLPNGKLLCLNGAKMGTAGYGNVSWAIGQSYADDPVLLPVLYDPDAPAGNRWSRQGFSPSTVPRMYHSSAVLLPDGSILVSGSNPNADYTAGPDVKYPTEYRTERFYPSYYNQRRPQPKGLPSRLTYGGPSFDVVLDADDLSGMVDNVANATVVVIRPGFSTHSMNMGQRMLILQSTYTGYSNSTAVIHASQLPPNPAIFAPGPALLFVVVGGVPSVGVQIMVGSGKLGTQPVLDVGVLPPSEIVRNDTVVKTDPDAGAGGVGTKKNSASSPTSGICSGWLLGALGPVLLGLVVNLA